MTAIVTRPAREDAPCPPSPEVELEARYVAAQDAIGAFVEDYREWDRANTDEHGARTRVLEHMDPMEQRDAAWECSCGQRTLPSDRKQTCNCWGKQNAPPNPNLLPTPDLIPTLTPRKEPFMESPAPAPFGLKADGTPRKRPAPTPTNLAKARAAKAERAKVKAAVTGTASPFLLKVVEDIDAEIARLSEARAVLAEAAAA